MKIFFFATIIFGFLQLTTLADAWIKKNDFAGEGRTWAAAFAINGKGYVGTGNTFYDVAVSDIWEYDPATDSWTQKADIPVGRSYAVGFAIGSKGYIGLGGTDAVLVNDFWEYDPIANMWTQKANFPGLPRTAAVGFSINGKGYIGTGIKSNLFNDFYEYDPDTDSWLAKKKFPSKRYSAVAFSLGGEGYVGSGTDGYVTYSDFFKYNPLSDTWIPVSDLPGDTRENAVAFTIDSFSYVGLGDRFYFPYWANDFWKYNSITDTWTQVTNYGGGATTVAVSFAIGSKGYVGLGTDSTQNDVFKTDLWEYNPDTLATLAADQLSDISSFSIFPNPVISSMMISFSLKQNSNITIEFMDLNGKKINKRFDGIFKAGNHQVKINRESIANGIYFLQMKLNDETVVKKIILE